MTDLTFVRRVDGLTYEFTRQGTTADGYPAFRRVDGALWCRRLPDYGWAVCTESGEVSGRPFGHPGLGDSPPPGMWVSGKGEKAYVYDVTVVGHVA